MKEGHSAKISFIGSRSSPLQIPPLRQRRDDIEVLAYHFLGITPASPASKVPEIDQYAIDLLKNYAWPGNVGELQNAIERACTFCEGKKLRPSDLPPKITQKIEVSAMPNTRGSSTNSRSARRWTISFASRNACSSARH